MAPKFWMVTDRAYAGGRLGGARGETTCWTADGGPLDRISKWRRIEGEAFRRALAATANGYAPLADRAAHEDQKHVCLFVHGAQADWAEAAHRYETVCSKLFSGAMSLGTCVFVAWPSDRLAAGAPDRNDVDACALDLAPLLVELFDWLAARKREAEVDPRKGCRAKTSVLAHGAGCDLFLRALALAWERRGHPRRTSLFQQVLLVAADVGNDLFARPEGEALSNLAHRTTSLFTGRDAALGLPAGMRTFGKRRLGRSGLDRSVPCPDNAWEVDCTGLLAKEHRSVYHAYFEDSKPLDLIRAALKGVDRGALAGRGAAPR